MDKNKKTASEIARRYLIFALGLLCMGFGVACLIKSGLGVSPISSLPYTFALLLPSITVGSWTALINIAMLLMQLGVKPDLPKSSLVVQALMTVCFGYFIDASLALLEGFVPGSYAVQFALLIVGCTIMAFGTYMDIIAKMGLLPMDSFLQLLAKRIGKQYTNLRIVSDLLMTATAFALCYICLGEIKAVREGTLVTALLCGTMIRFFTAKLDVLTYLLLPENHIVLEPEVEKEVGAANSHFVLTVSHEYGSGGRTIARRIAHELNLPYYDTEIIKMAAAKSEFAADYLHEHEEKISSNALYTLYDLYAASLPQAEAPLPEQIFRLEAQVIQEIAAQDSCVIVGRLANYVLQKHKNSLHIFVTADEDQRVKRVMRKDNIDSETALEKIREYAAERKNHCQQFSDMEWGNGKNYDITVKSNRYGVDRTAAILIEMIKEFRLLQV